VETDSGGGFASRRPAEVNALDPSPEEVIVASVRFEGSLHVGGPFRPWLGMLHTQFFFTRDDDDGGERPLLRPPIV
jgi:hypothetical protein